MKIALLNDSHFGARSDNQYLLDYFEKFYSEIFFPFIDKTNINTIIHLGDVFDRRKYINYVTLQRTKRMFFDEVRRRELDMHILLGNHDTYFRNSNDLNSPNLLLKDYDFKIYERPENVEFETMKVLFLPWITAETQEEAEIAIQEVKSQIIMGHLEIKGFDIGGGRISDHGFDQSVFDRYMAVLSGHFHKKATYNGIMYLGVQYEMTWNDYGQQKGFHVIDTENLSIDFIENPHKLFHRLVYDNGISDLPNVEGCYVKLVVKNKVDSVLFDNTLERINSMRPNHLIVTEENAWRMENSPELNITSEDTLTFINRYVKENSIPGDKDKLVSLFSDLYKRANELEI